MECPRCIGATDDQGPYRASGGVSRRTVLQPTTHPSGVVAHTCGGCGGAFLEEGALTQVRAAAQSRGEPEPAARDVLRRAYGHAHKPTEEPAIECPACHVEMIEAEWGFGSLIAIDTCPTCGGAWADGGEIADIERYYGKPS